MQGSTTIATIVNYRIALEFDSFSHCFFIRFRAPENCNNHVVTTTTTTKQQQQQPKKHRIDCVQQVLVKYIYFFLRWVNLCKKEKHFQETTRRRATATAATTTTTAEGIQIRQGGAFNKGARAR